MTKDVEWTSPVIARLKELLAHNDSLSYSFIANQLMKDFPGFKFTRNGISGKVWRMKLPPREKIVIRANGDRPRKPYIKPPKKPKPDAFAFELRESSSFSSSAGGNANGRRERVPTHSAASLLLARAHRIVPDIPK